MINISNVKNKELVFLSNLVKVLTQTEDSIVLAKLLGGVFRKFISLDTFGVYIYDKNTSTMKDFFKDLYSVQTKEDTEHLNSLGGLLKLLNSDVDFFINSRPLKIEHFENINPRIFNDGNNSVVFPLMKGKKTFGFLELNFYNNIANSFDNDSFLALYTAASQIALKVQNMILDVQMKKNIDFHESMKNIAKIIETQYELNYIIPIIGEMIDKFIVEHLIYIFLREEESSDLKLVWPLACNDRIIFDYLPLLESSDNYKLIENGKIGFFPLVGENNLLGCIVAKSNNEKLNQGEIDYLKQLSQQSSITIHRANVYAEVLQHATLDALTGLNNRRQFEVRLKQEVAAAKRQSNPLCAIMIDIDFFKKVNDTYGHIAGDAILKSVSDVIKNTIRESDIPCRYGGEEFAILLPFTEIEDAGVVAHRIREAVEANRVDLTQVLKNPSEHDINVTVSVGIYQIKSDDSPEDLYSNADKALYKAKESGRNKVMVLS